MSLDDMLTQARGGVSCPQCAGLRDAAEQMAKAGHELADALFALGRGEITTLSAGYSLAKWNSAMEAWEAAK